MSEVEQQMFDERMAAADAGLTNVQTAEDRFPAEDVIRAEQEKALLLTRASQMADNERRQMAGFEEAAARNAAADKVAPETTTVTETVAPETTVTTETVEPETTTPDLTTQVEKVVADPDSSTSDKNTGAAKTVLSAAGLVDPAKPLSAKDAVSAYEKMFKEMLGEDDEDKAKEMWHNMAMIGFAIASGESPRALQNIANGLLAGTKMMKEDRASERKREDAITTMAIEAGLEDQRAAQKYARDLAIAKIRGTDSIYGKRTDPMTATLRLAETLYAGGAGDYDTYEDALDAARATINQEYGLTTTRTSTTELEPDALAAHKTANDTAKAAGQSTYIGPDGITYKVQ